MKLWKRKMCFLKTVKLNILIFTLSSMLLSCGYTLQGAGNLPGNPKRISVLLFKNRSSHISAETTLANALIEELMRSSGVEIAGEPDNADAVIQGEIISISFGALSRKSTDSVNQRTVYERTVTAVVNLTMKSRSGEVLFSVNRFSEHDSYRVLEDNEEDESAKREVVQKLFHRLSQRVVSQMTDDF